MENIVKKLRQLIMHGPLIDFRYDGQNTDWTVILFVQNSGGSRGGSGGSNEPPRA